MYLLFLYSRISPFVLCHNLYNFIMHPTAVIVKFRPFSIVFTKWCAFLYTHHDICDNFIGIILLVIQILFCTYMNNKLTSKDWLLSMCFHC